MEPRIKEGTLVVVRDIPIEEFYWDPPGDAIGIVQEKLSEDSWVVNCGSYGSFGVSEERLIPLAEILPPKDQELSPEEALQKYLPEVIITLAKTLFLRVNHLEASPVV